MVLNFMITNRKSIEDSKKPDVKIINEQVKANVPAMNLEKPKSKKAKLMRIERKKEKLLQKGISSEEITPRKTKSIEKSLEDLLGEEDTNGVFRLKVYSIINSIHNISNYLTYQQLF